MKNMLHVFFCIVLFSCSSSPETTLEKEFKTPPEHVQTSVYWYWMCGNISREGVIEDLKAMKRAGINRAFIGHNYFDPYEGGRNVKLMSDEWWDVMHTALKTASDLDIEIGIFNCPGWTQAGGPWVKPSESMRYLTSSEIRARGPATFTARLPQPAETFEDVKVIAYPAPAEEHVPFARGNPPEVFDGDRNKGIDLPQGKEVCINLTAPDDFTARSLTVYPTHAEIKADFELQAKIGDAFQTIATFTIDWHHLQLIVGFQPYAPVVITLAETKAKEYRLLARNHHHQGGIAEVELSASPRIEQYAQKTFAKMCEDPLPMGNFYAWREQPEVSNPALYIRPEKVLDISQYMTADGLLTWEVPQGEWVIVRTGMTSTGVTNNPAGPDGTGLETDKINRQHIATHFDAYIGRILKRIPAEDRSTFRVVVQDSYESGGQNFTDGFLDRFKDRYGYDALPFLPAYFGKVVGTQAESDRFLWDMRRLVADGIAYEYVGGFRELCHKHGLRTWLENYGHWGFASEFLMYGGQSDEVGGEYWLPNAFPSWENNLGIIENRAASSCAHIYGKTLVSSESNTSGAPAFSRVPADAKQRTDKYFAEGVNNTLLHVYIHQPDTDKFPGTNAWFGTEFNRENTWFSHIDLFLAYIKRCNYMLRQGLNVADVAYFIGEDAPKMTGVQDPSLPTGYQFDYINAEVLVRDAVVKDGRITLPHGTSYRVLVLPKSQTMRPEVLARIKQLANEGAIIAGPAPSRSPSLQNQPEADRQVQTMAEELWGAADGQTVHSARVGKGMIFNGRSLEEIFAQTDCIADCKIPDGKPIHFGHRHTDKAEIYFISNQSDRMQETSLTFRVAGLQPEWWDPIHGATRKLAEYSSTKATTTVPVRLEAYESAFIVFREKGRPVAGSRNFPEPVKVADLTNRWDICFEGKVAVPAPIRLDKLQDLATFDEDNIRYYSGNMIYTTTFDLDRTISPHETLLLDLGKVAKMAKVWVNDQYVGGVWTPPYSVNISPAVKQGNNTLRIDVVNTWVNRLIGDMTLPREERRTWTGIHPYGADSPLQETGLIGPVAVYAK
ncbi:MAG: glycoside hydrolase family 2 [Tannerellaceae bacterium]|jgi:hypothetical protein|nr:glycoside hydrolase family 2 [Tannerellaceae bacterium]